MATGFNNTPPASEFRKYGSWGRTRGPKPLGGQANTALVSVASLGAAKTITDAFGANVSKAKPTSGVYSTENQRFLHIATIDGGAVTNIWTYSYAFGIWSQLVDSSGNALTVADGQHKIFEIAGVDLVAFKLSDAESVYAACSTF